MITHIDNHPSPKPSHQAKLSLSDVGHHNIFVRFTSFTRHKLLYNSTWSYWYLICPLFLIKKKSSTVDKLPSSGSDVRFPWCRLQMETFSALPALCAGNSPVTGEFLSQRPATQSFDVFFALRRNKRWSKHSSNWWFETSTCPLWRHCNVDRKTTHIAFFYY